jgi:hypothetical protein
MRYVLLMVTVFGFSATAAMASGTPDGVTPAVETVCDGETGAAYGLCTAYCEAMDCDDPNVEAAPTACAAVRSNFMRKTGRELPCLVDPDTGDTDVPPA